MRHRSHPLIVPAMFVVVMSCVTAIACGADWSLTTADLRSQTAAPRALSSDGLRFTSSDGKTERTIPLDQFVSVQRSAVDEPSTPKFTLVLSNGDRLVGEPGSVSGERLIWLSPLLGKVSVPFNRLAAINHGLDFSTPDEPPKQDMAKLANGDVVAGVFTGCADQKVTIQADVGPVAVPLDSIRRITFAPTAVVAATDSVHGYRIRTDDGSLFTVANAGLDGDTLKVTELGKSAVTVNLPMSSILSIEQVNGPVGWLSLQTPTESVQTPYFNGPQTWPARFDLAVDGSPLCFNGRVFDHGIGVHAYSRLVFALDPQWLAFRTQYAIDSKRDEPRKYADVTVRIKLDDKVVLEKKHVHEGEISNLVMLDLSGAKTLTLECDFGDGGDTQAHLDWLQPALLRSLPAPAATTNPTTQPF